MTLQLLHVGDLTDVRVSPILGCGLCSSSPSGETRSLRKAGKGKTWWRIDTVGVVGVQPGDRCICVAWCCCGSFINVRRQSLIRQVYSSNFLTRNSHTHTHSP
jgi:hypothetical protein